jgi:hypothetical protein
VSVVITDGEGGIKNCNFTVVITDDQAPVAVCQNITVSLNGAGTATITAAQVNNGSSDNCTLTNLSVAPSSFTCANIGTNPVVLTVTDSAGQVASCNATVTVTDTTPPQLVAGSISPCHATALAAETAAISATVVSDNCAVTNVSASTVGTCSAIVTVTAADSSGNTASVIYNTRIDAIAPVISSLTATQGVQNVINCATNVLQGSVQITVTAADACGLAGGSPSVTLTNGVNSATLVCIGTNGATYTYQWTVTATTTNGTWAAIVTASDNCNSTTSTFSLCVNKFQITGNVALQSFVGTGTVPLHSRVVTFFASGGFTTKSWSLLVTNVSGSNFNYTLTDVPSGTTLLSAKTAWNLRKRLPAVFDLNGQSVVNFDGVNFLRGGDMNGDNLVQFVDYSVLSANWFTANPVADLNGDGFVQLLDYSLLGINWFTSGDPP